MHIRQSACSGEKPTVRAAGLTAAAARFPSHTRCRSAISHNALFAQLANMLQARALNARFVRSGSKARAYSLHPGAVRTELTRNSPSILIYIAQPFFLLFSKTPLQGAQTTLHCAMAPHSDLKGGAYYADCAEKEYGGPKALWESDELAERFLQAVEAMATSGKPMESMADA